MLEIATGRSRRNCEGATRREFLQVGTLALGGLTLPGLLSARANAAAAGNAVKATSVVLLFLTGGPSHIETFDPKMTAPAEYRSVTGEVQSRIPGVTLGATFAKLAGQTHKMALVRSFTHENPVTLDNLFATAMHVLFDVSSLRRQADLPRDIASLLDRSRPIAQLI